MKNVVVAIAVALSAVAHADGLSASEGLLMTALSQRDAVDCPSLFVSDAPQTQRALLDIASREHALPWIAPRAVRCLIEVRGDDVEVGVAMRQWVSDQERPGLMVVVARFLPMLAPQHVQELLPLVRARVRQEPRLEGLVMSALRSTLEVESSK